ncbi:hypothetical protein A9W95_01465 [Mycobacterium sp. 1423905.2]|nr:alpha/beta hydrolase [Mycobacterium sp. 1423905.2]OBJ54752.1 hypothetical protein A9W95_01465 [Mycobacterium sp. 1423905.2]
MADDLATVLGRLDTGTVHLVAHDWWRPVAFIMMLRHPGKVRGFFGFNTIEPWYVVDGGPLLSVPITLTPCKWAES